MGESEMTVISFILVFVGLKCLRSVEADGHPLFMDFCDSFPYVILGNKSKINDKPLRIRDLFIWLLE